MRSDPAGGAATTGTGRVGNVDVLRAVAAFGVVASHAYFLGGRVLPVRAEHWYDVPLLASTTGVYLFFAISGYVIAKPFVDRLVAGDRLPALVPYALRRGFRIFPLYWIALTTMIVVVGAGTTRPWHYLVHYSLLHNLVPGRQQAIFSVAWTLTIEVLFYMAVPLLALALHRRGTRRPERLAAVILASFAASVAFTAVAGLADAGKTGIWLRTSFIAYWQLFCPGLLLALAPHLRSRAWRRWLVEFPASRAAPAVAAAMLVAGTLLFTLAPRGLGLETWQLVTDSSRPLFAAGFGIVLAWAIHARRWFARRGRFVLHLGLISYGIYLLHAVATSVLLTPEGREFIPFPREGVLPYVVHLVFLSTLAILLAMASWRWLERPLIELSRTLSTRWAGRGQPTASAAAPER